nr:MAG TPA: hypothetical protein [Caudoviricetes sp.]
MSTKTNTFKNNFMYFPIISPPQGKWMMHKKII